MFKKILLSCFMFFFCTNISLAEPLSPRDRIEGASTQIINLLLEEDFQQDETKPIVIEKIEAVVLDLFDFSEFSVRTVGAPWRRFTPEQKKSFQTAFTKLLHNSYIHTLNSYGGESLAYVGEMKAPDGKRVEVHTLFKAKDKEYPVAFRMILKKNSWVVYDVIIEGVSMVKNYREQFREMLAGGNPDDLIQRIEAKALEQYEKNMKPVE